MRQGSVVAAVPASPAIPATAHETAVAALSAIAPQGVEEDLAVSAVAGVPSRSGFQVHLRQDLIIGIGIGMLLIAHLQWAPLTPRACSVTHPQSGTAPGEVARRRSAEDRQDLSDGPVVLGARSCVMRRYVRCMRRGGLLIGGLLAAVVLGGLAAPPVLADGPVTVTASGPASVTTSSDTSTGRVVATFVVADTSLTATGATICRSYGDKKRFGCTYQRFDAPAVDEYGDPVEYDAYTSWDIVGGPGSWTVSYPIGFDGISREECLAAGWQKDPFYATIEVQNDASIVLATGSWTYTVNCTGIEGAVTWPRKTRVYAGRSTTSKPWTYFILDTRHVLNTYRICRFNAYLDRYGSCDYEDLTSRERTDTGWTISYRLTFTALGSSTCAWVGRQWPDAGFRLQVFSGNLDKRLTMYGTTKLDC